MLLKDENKEIDFFENWPQHYYEIADSAKRKEVLLTAIEQQLDPNQDALRLTLYEKRYGNGKKKNSNIDNFLRAWMMIKASSAAGVSRFQKRLKQRELKQFMEDLNILEFPNVSREEQLIIEAEWTCFARYYITSCTQSRTYCHTLFGILPIKDAIVAEKLANEINLVTCRYPNLLDMADSFQPFCKAVSTVYCQMIENGEKYWTSAADAK